MADNRYIPDRHLDLVQIINEARYRWLRPIEICYIIRNHQQLKLQTTPPNQPEAGTLFLFDRKSTRYFRKDGHRWRKKKDGKTIKEAHEKLKIGSVDALHCYYAHGENNENFQRRSYWMLEGQLEHIVFVHYRELKEGYKSGVSRLVADPGSQIQNPQTNSAQCITQNSPDSTVQTSYASCQNRIDYDGQTVSSEVDDVDSGDDPRASSAAQGSVSRDASLLPHEVAGFPDLSKDPPDSWLAGAKFGHGATSCLWSEVHSLSRNAFNVHDQKLFFEQPSGADFLTHKITDSRLDTDSKVPDFLTCIDRLITHPDVEVATSSQSVIQVPQENDFKFFRPQHQNYSHPLTVVDSVMQVVNKTKDGGVNNIESHELKKLDSFGRWMDKEIGGDCDDSFMASDSGTYWNTLGAENDDKEVSSLSRQLQLDIGSLGPSLSQEQLFSIRDFSPDWALSGVKTKVLIVGTFLGSKKLPNSTSWGCMFGEIEVPAEVLSDCAIRCQSPLHTPGSVPFYVTCRNRLACSEVRDFQYLEKPPEVTSPVVVRPISEEDVCLQIRLAKLISLGLERKWLNCFVEDCDGCKIKNVIYSLRADNEKDWEQVQGTSTSFKDDYRNSKDKLIQILLKDRLYEWLVCKVHEAGKGPQVLDVEGQGVIHLAAGLGYEWAMGPIVAAGVNINFRDARGRTGLHWASYFGREETVIALVRLGAYLGAVDDPTPVVPGGQTAADLASSRGHKGIAGYLAEAFLTSHLSLLTLNQNVMEKVAVTSASKKAAETLARGVLLLGGEVNDKLSPRGPIAAVEKSSHAAALIQDAFRVNAFRYRQQNESKDYISGVSLDLVALGSLNKVQKMSHFEDYLHSAALRIQRRYRGWKKRREFLKMRNRIVKIQALVRGHQVRNKYKKIVWSVSIMEKVILRWRRRGVGLRGFQAGKAISNVLSEVDKTDDYEFLRISREQKFAGVENALARVKSMARNPVARDQYMRLVKNFEDLKPDG
ncbi:IQ domain-containing protein/CG-1 domain-containing protein/Ank_2 domain-containing protein [Cephalotus follicularis]|uniref:IQ domain-containing protein/CG-1 domain-containing protein/Ank_2 domain-containing protein n=1 Tax=Cephalotus follicularis TaxID=3775 RepID=A0A1Q3BUH8_CEPFO|nr:IQ domain-containing protein/CG-1 domain-containing protein/Ank_2 domain-containing protein [Cephalotus follicularis]